MFINSFLECIREKRILSIKCSFYLEKVNIAVKKSIISGSNSGIWKIKRGGVTSKLRVALDSMMLFL